MIEEKTATAWQKADNPCGTHLTLKIVFLSVPIFGSVAWGFHLSPQYPPKAEHFISGRGIFPGCQTFSVKTGTLLSKHSWYTGIIGHCTRSGDPKWSTDYIKESGRLGCGGCKVVTVNEIAQDLWTGKREWSLKKKNYGAGWGREANRIN